MKRIDVLIIAILLLVACNSSNTAKEANFKNFHFVYDSSLATLVTAKILPENIVPANENWNEPQHTLFTPSGYQPEYGHGHQQPLMAVYSVEDFKKINPYFEKEALSGLRSVLANKPTSISPATTRLPDPFGCYCFAYLLPEYIKFKSGSGVRFVAYQHGQSVEPIANSSLEYVFHGLTDDGQYYISAILPANVSFLADWPSTKDAAIPTHAPKNANAQ